MYRFQARWVHEWRRGRVLLAGDAAHQTPPFAGQGLCSGLRDAANLAWKLDLVLPELAPDALLDTYGLGAGPHMQAVIELAIDMGKMICVADPAEAAPATRRSSPPTTAASPTSRRSPASPPASSSPAHRRRAICSSKPRSRATASRPVRRRRRRRMAARHARPGRSTTNSRDWFAGIGGAVVPSACTAGSRDVDGRTASGSPTTASSPRCNGPTSSLFGTATTAGTAELVRSLRDALQST